MQYALVNDIRTEPAKGLKGLCPACQKEVQSKCGAIKAHHWAHVNLKDCDSWGEPETQWHIDWKNKFPKEYREVIFRDEETNEIHRADIHTPKGVTIEFQNSPISFEELCSRDDFYRQIIWVVNAAKFQIETSCFIPDPRSPLLDDYVFRVDDNGFGRHLKFSRKTDMLDDPFGAHQVFGIEELKLREKVKRLLDEADGKYRMITWKNKHAVWLSTIKPVFLDFGHNDIYWLRFRYQGHTALRYLQVVKKSDFIKKYSL